MGMDELFRHAEKYAESIIERARNEAALANRERHPCLSVVTLLSQVLANRPNDVFADSVRKNNALKDAFAEALKVSATLGRKPATWAGMPEIAALATLLQVNIRTLWNGSCVSPVLQFYILTNGLSKTGNKELLHSYRHVELHWTPY